MALMKQAGHSRTGDTGDTAAAHVKSNVALVLSWFQSAFVADGRIHVTAYRCHPTVATALAEAQEPLFPTVQSTSTLFANQNPCISSSDCLGWSRLKAQGKDTSLTPEQLRDDPELLAELDTAVAEANKAVSQAEAIKKFRVLGDDFTEDNGTLTPSLKLKRAVVMKQFSTEVEALYTR